MISESTPSPRPPNIIFIFSDQHRHDALGCAQHPVVRTPNLDRLAGEGVRFSRAWCQSPICQPSRAALITGRYPHELDILRNFGPDFDPAWPTFMKSLQAAGYATANVGKTHYYKEGLVPPEGPERDLRKKGAFIGQFGFDHVIEEFDRYVHAMDGVRTHYTEYLREQGVFEPYRDQLKKIWRLTPTHWDAVTSPLSQEHDLTSFLTRAALDWLERQNSEQPFFLQLSYVQPHVPLMGDPTWAAHYENQAIRLGPREPAKGLTPLWETYLEDCREHSQADRLSDDYVRRGARQYFAMISLIDQCIGNVLSFLERRGLLDNTLLVYSSDHGEMLGDHGLMAKFNFYQGSVQVPLIVRPPGGCQPRVSDELVELSDVSATLLDAAGTPGLAGARGRSLLPATKGKRVGREALFSEIRGHDGRAPDSPVFTGMRNERYRFTLERTRQEPCELFDLEADPDERRNLVNEANQGSLVANLHEQLDSIMARE